MTTLTTSTGATFSRILGIGGYRPRRVVDNAEIVTYIDSSDEWIRTRSGIVERRWASEDETVSMMSQAAARKALERAGVEPGQIDTVIVSTVTHLHQTPAIATTIASELGAKNAAAFDISAACTGWVYGMTVAEGLIASGVIETALVVSAEKMSAIVDWKDRATCVLFGDGAGATVLKRAKTHNKGILSAYMRSDGTLAELLWRPSGGAAVPFSETVLQDRSSYVKMAGREVFKHAVRQMSEACDRALDGAKLTGSDIDVLIPHQANNRIIEATAKHAGISMEKVYVNVDRYGNTSSASIPIALDEAVERGRIREGTTALFCAFGAGFTWGSMVVRF